MKNMRQTADDMMKTSSPTFASVGAPGMMCVPQETMIEDVRLAHAYVPMQKLCTTYIPQRALSEGTVFPELSRAYEQSRWQYGGEWYE